METVPENDGQEDQVARYETGKPEGIAHGAAKQQTDKAAVLVG